MDQWLWVDGESTLAGVDLLTTPGPRLISVLAALYIRMATQDREVVQVHRKVIAELTRLASAPAGGDLMISDVEAGMMFGIRGGPVGELEG